MVRSSVTVSSALGVIIAGGQSRRFNQVVSEKNNPRDKFLMPFGKTTLLGHIIDRARQQLPEVILNINGDQRRVSSYGLDVIPDDVADAGPLGGILAGLKEAGARGYSHIITFSGDCPFFPDDYGDRLVQAEREIAVACTGEKPHPVMGFFAVSLQDDLRAYLAAGERRVMVWVRRHPHEKVVWDEKTPDPFFNINRPGDLAQAEGYLS